jgi:hypothetical protein
MKLRHLADPRVDESSRACRSERKACDALQTLRSNAARTAGRA